MLKIVLVGCGKIADAHVEAIQNHPKVRLTAVCDIEPLMAEQLATRYSVPRSYGDFDRMLEAEQPDVVHITAPPGVHVPLGLRAIRAGAHLFVEKPLALNHLDARTLLDAAAAAGRLVTAGYMYNFDPIALELNRIVDSGAIGDPVHIESFYGYNLKGDFGAAILADPAHWVHNLPGKLFHNTIDHLLNKIAAFLPDDRPDIQAHAFQRSAWGATGGDLYDELRVTLYGRKVSAYATFSANIRPMGHFLRVYGTRHSLHADFVARTVVLEPAQNLPTALGRLIPAFTQAIRYGRAALKNTRRFARAEFHFFQGLRLLIDAFYDSVENQGAPPIAYRDMLRVAAWMDEIFAQLPSSTATGATAGAAKGHY